jgi:hypothetical protein
LEFRLQAAEHPAQKRRLKAELRTENNPQKVDQAAMP